MLSKLHNYFFEDQWYIGMVEKPAGFQLEQLPELPFEFHYTKGFFLADPCFYEESGEVKIICEYFRFSEQIGRIKLLNWHSKTLEDIPGLKSAKHQSYPIIYRHADQDFVFLEQHTTSKPKIKLLDKSGFSISDTQMNAIKGALDETPLFLDGTLYLFHTIFKKGGNDQLRIAYKKHWEDPEWITHPVSPRKSDFSSSRSGGKIIHLNGRLIRPTQNCKSGYGKAINFMEIEKLTETEFREKLVLTVQGKDILPGFDGIHNIDIGEKYICIDAKKERFRPLKPFYLLYNRVRRWSTR
jgi:hypothetical protein